jgi:3-oxoacyl-[acyl-carrier-protein] synthase III
MVDTSDEWIMERTGIRERRIAAPDEALSDLCLPAARDALAQAGVEASAIDLIVVATVTPDMLFPSTGAIIADELGASDAAAYDLSAGCTGFMYAVAQAYGMIAAGLSQRALVVGGDVLSKLMDWTDRSTCVLFGDGAGAVVVSATTDESKGVILDFEHEIDGSGGPALCMPAGGSRRPSSHETIDERLHYVKQDGATVFKFAVRKTEEISRRILERNGLTPADLNLFVSHQANRRIIQSATERLGVEPGKVIINIERFGNTTAATIPLALNDAVCSGRLKKGDLVLLASVGAGFTVGTVLLRWGI